MLGSPQPPCMSTHLDCHLVTTNNSPNQNKAQTTTPQGHRQLVPLVGVPPFPESIYHSETTLS